MLPSRAPPLDRATYDRPVSERLPSLPPDGRGPTALPAVHARAVAFAAILVAGLFGFLIGSALVRIQCRGSCGAAVGYGGLAGALIAAGGVAVVSVLVLRAMGEWQSRR